MSFSYDAGLASDADLVRFHIGDTSEDGHFLEDETIAKFLTDHSLGESVILCINYIITKLSVPDFRLDWLTVTNKEARLGYESLLARKKQELGVYTAVASSSVSLPTRADSYQDSDSVYDGAP